MTILLFGATGQVGGAVLRAFLASDTCTKITLLNRREVVAFNNEPKITQVIVDTAASDFEQRTAEIARGHDAAACCVGIGAGSASMPEEELLRLEVDIVGAYARGCKAAGVEVFELLTAVGVTEKSVASRVKYVRVMGKKLKTVMDAGFAKLAVFRPGTIVGNKHTPGWAAWVAKLIPDSFGWGAVHQDAIGRAFAVHLERVGEMVPGVVYYDNKEIKMLAGNA